MICHVCHEPASGQCKSCLRFYCPRHGDRTCSECAGVTAEPLPAMPSAALQEDEPLPSIALPGADEDSGGPKCYTCMQRATRACRRCGRFYCKEHGSRMMVWGNQCQGCEQSGCLLGFIGAVIFVVLAMIVLAMSGR